MSGAFLLPKLRKGVLMNNIFQLVKENVKVSEVAESCGIKLHRGNMCVCPFHQDKHPSMKIYDDHYYCFACGVHGDVIDLVANQYGVGALDAAIKIAEEFHLPYDNSKSDSYKYEAYDIKKSEARKWAEDKRMLCQQLSRLHSFLREMKNKYAPKSEEDSVWSPLFKWAVDDYEIIDYYYELFILNSTDEQQKILYNDLKKEIEKIERRCFKHKSIANENEGGTEYGREEIA